MTAMAGLQQQHAAVPGQTGLTLIADRIMHPA